MDNPGDLMHLCRLCLVKDQVNIPIFEEHGDIRQIFVKISSCLPVKVSKDDQLPKRICDGCSNKLDLLYEFCNTSANSEKKLLSWLEQAGLKDVDTISAVAQHTAKPLETQTQVKQEALEDIHAAVQQTDHLELTDEGVGAAVFEENAIDESDEPPPPKRARRTAAVKAQINITPDSDDDDDMDISEPMTKVEDESDDSDVDKDPSYVDVPGTSADDQPGPSGVGKDGVEAPQFEAEDFFDFELEDEQPTDQYQCGICSKIFPNKNKFIEHHINMYNKKLTCCKCSVAFKSLEDLYEHHETHKDIDLEFNCQESQEDEVEQLVFSDEVIELPHAVLDDGSQFLYILDEPDGNCVNEVVIQEDELVQNHEMVAGRKLKETLDLVNMEHGYMLPSSMEADDERMVLSKKISLSNAPGCGNKRLYTPPKPRAPQPRRRHEVPDFSATEFIQLEANEELDTTHYKCIRCEQIFINKFGFFRHIEKGKCFINSCDVCNATFSKNSEFYSHYIAQHTDRAICNFCFRTFMYEKNVKGHMLRHLDQFRHRCEECNKGFYTVREYRSHYKNRHMGIRHKCDVCGRSFADEYYFKKHIATHAKVNFTVVQLQ